MKPHAGLLRNPSCAVAFGFGLGLLPWMPGTFGALLALPLGWLMRGLPMVSAAGVVLALVALGIFVSNRVEQVLGTHDHGAIVWDEVCGALIVLLTVPPSIAWWIAAFVAFRVFDIVKPWPIRLVDERLPGGLGVMMDDVVAGIFAAILLWAVRLFPLP
jgi:phosphatidylglycerophosphatase A